jgi:hypothetical protein
MKVQVEAALAEKAGGMVVARLCEHVASLNSHFEALNSSVFEAFKVEIRRSLASKVDSSTIEETISSLTASPSWQQVLKRLETAENLLNASGNPRETAGNTAETGKGREDLVKWVTGTRQDVDLLKERMREWRADMEERCVKLEEGAEKWKQMWTKEVEKVRNRWETPGKRNEKTSETEEDAAAAVKSPVRTNREETAMLKRLVRLETEVDSLHLTMDFIKTRQRDRINEFSKQIQHLTDHKEAISRDFFYLQTRLNELESTQRSDILAISEELGRLKGPMTDLLNTQALESDALHGEIKRHQEVLRSFVSDRGTSTRLALTPTIKTTPPPFISPQKLNLIDRVQSASPAFKLRRRLRPGYRREEAQEDSNSFSSPRTDNSISLERRRVGTSRGGTTRRKTNAEAAMSTNTPQFLE